MRTESPIRLQRKNINMRCAITGASGYVGSRIRQALKSGDFDVVELGRGPTADIRFDLEHADRLHLPSDIDALIHCAWALHMTEWSDIERVNIDGSKKLFQSAKQAGVKKLIFISSLSAFEGARSKYGRSKLFVEREALDRGGVVIRPGLIFGDGSSGGMVGSLEKLAGLLPVLPMVGWGGQRLHWCHEEDMGRLLITVLKNEGLPPSGEPRTNGTMLIAAASRSWRFADIIRHLARKRGRSIWLFIPLPPQLIWLGLRALEKLRIKPPFHSDSLVSLLNQDPHPDLSAIRGVGASFRDFGSTEPHGF